MYVRIVEGQAQSYTLNRLAADFPNISFPENPPAEVLEQFLIYPLAETQRPLETVTHKVVEEIRLIEGVWTQTWLFVERSLEEQEEEQTALEKRLRDQAVEKASLDAARMAVAPQLDEVSDEDLALYAFLFDPWKVGVAYKVDDKARFNDILYKCIQPHTSEASWTPPVVPALWVRVREEGSNAWVPGIQVSVFEQYTYEGVLYTVVQAHTTQVGWEPPNVPALWSVA